MLARTRASVGKSYPYEPSDGRLVFADFLIRTTPHSTQLRPAQSAYYLQNQGYWVWIANTAVRSGQPSISSREYGSLPVHLSPLPELRAMPPVLTDMDGEIAAQVRRLRKTRPVKPGMLRRFLGVPSG